MKIIIKNASNKHIETFRSSKKDKIENFLISKKLQSWVIERSIQLLKSQKKSIEIRVSQSKGEGSIITYQE